MPYKGASGAFEEDPLRKQKPQGSPEENAHVHCPTVVSDGASLPSGRNSGQDELVIPETVRETPIVLAVRKASNSVVSISTKARIPRDFPRIMEGREVPEGQGSGVIIDRDGLVITNFHVVFGRANQPADSIWVTTYEPRKKYKAEIVTFDSASDLAVLRIIPETPGTVFTPITRGTSSDLMVGETVIAIGNPFGQEHTVTVGVLSASGREIRVPDMDGRLRLVQNLLQTDAAINPGNSGGALINLTGKLIGINNAMRRESEGIGYAIPVDTVDQVLDGLLALDKAGTFWLGMQLEPEGGSLAISGLIPEGPAWRSGLREGDRILGISGRETRDIKEFTAAFLTNIQEGRVPLTLRRGERTLEIEFRPGTRIARFLFEHAGLEAVTTPLTEEEARLLYRTAGVAVRALSAAVVTRVYPDGPAFETGLQVGGKLVAFTAIDRFFGQRDIQIPTVEVLAQTLSSTLGKGQGAKYNFMVLQGGELYRGTLTLR